MSLPQQHRLRGHRVFERLYRRGQCLHGPLMVLRVLSAEPGLLPPSVDRFPLSPWRCGVVVSSKVSKLAVRRNRLRRLLQAHLLNSQPSPASPQWFLVSLKPGSAEVDPGLLLGECSHLLRKAGLV